MDQHTEVGYRSLGDNLIDSLKGVVVGIVLFLVSFPILWWNEGRTDISTVAKRAVIVDATTGAASSTGEGKLVSVTGAISGDAPIGDPEYLKPGPWVRLRREVEMYAWVETVTKKETKQLGGGTKVEKTYSYEKKWTAHPQDSSEFKVPDGHENPSLDVHAATFSASRAHVGGFGFTLDTIELPTARPVALTDAMLPPHGPRRVGDMLYLDHGGRGTPEAPRVGDVRIKFAAVENTRQVTAFGQRQGTELVAYLHAGKDRLFRVVDGTHAEAVAHLHAEHTAITWILRLVGFLFMWLGLALVLGPINAVLDIIPLLGSAGRALTGIALFPVALVLTGITILASILAHNPLVLLGVVVIVIVGVVVLVQRRAARRHSTVAA
jgi:hypothetical protein